MSMQAEDRLIVKTPDGLLAAMWLYTQPVRLTLLASTVLALTSNVVKLSLPLLAGLMINVIQLDGAAGLAKCRPYFIGLLLAFAFIWTVRVPAKLAQFRLARTAQQNMFAALNRRLFAAPMAWHEARHSGDTASRMGQSTGALFSMTLALFGNVESLILMIGPIVAVFILSPQVCLYTLMGYAVIATICFGVDHYQRAFWIKESDAHRVFGTALVDFFRNIMAIYASRRERSVVGILQQKQKSVFSIVRTNLVITEFKWSGIEIISTALGLILMIVYISQFATKGQAGRVELGNVFMVQAYVAAGSGALLAVVGSVSTFMRQRTDFATAEPILAIPVIVASDQRLPMSWRELSLAGLSFSYGGAAPALVDVDVTLQRGRRYALVGRNGSGKSTLLKILSGLLPPETATLRGDGEAVDFGALRNSATLVPQNPELLNGTLADNLFVEAAETWSDKSVAERRVLDLLIGPLGVGLGSDVVEGGANWSGGQRQRIAVARGLLSALDSQIVLVDEPTSSVDAIDERIILDKLGEMFADKCLVISLHNLELLNRFDEVIVLDRGRVIDVGPPSLVRQRCDYFRQVDKSDGVAHATA